MHHRALPVALLALGLAACSAAPAQTPPESATTTSGSAQPGGTVTFGVVGDSLTAGTKIGLPSWVHGALGAPLALTGGWAVPGAFTSEMRIGLHHVDADVLVVLAGTNDVEYGVPWWNTRDNLLGIVAEAGVHEVVVSTLPPLDRFPAERDDCNRRLLALADEQGWHLVDPWTAVQLSGGWAPGTTLDGVHPTAAVADEAGRVIRAAVLAVGRN
jgi:lysophospholipase L1-like esterase